MASRMYVRARKQLRSSVGKCVSKFGVENLYGVFGNTE